MDGKIPVISNTTKSLTLCRSRVSTLNHLSKVILLRKVPDFSSNLDQIAFETDLASWFETGVCDQRDVIAAELLHILQASCQNENAIIKVFIFQIFY